MTSAVGLRHPGPLGWSLLAPLDGNRSWIHARHIPRVDEIP